MEFHIDSKKNTALLIVLSLVTLGSLVFVWYLPISLSVGRKIAVMIFSFGGYTVSCARCIYDYKTTVTIDHTGLKMFRRGTHYNLKWNQIRRIEYKGVKWCRLFDVLVFHTTLGKVYIEYNFANYREAWNVVKHFLSEYSPDSIVDRNVPD